MDYMRISYEKLKSLSDRVFQWYGYTREEAAIITDVMLQADLMGIESHGIQRLILYTGGLDIGRINRNAVMRVIKETPVSTVFDADDGMGQLAAHKAMSLAVQKAKLSGIGWVAVSNSNHFGMAGYYSLMAAKEHLLGMCMTNTQALVVPTFGRQPLLGTNPIAVSMPAKPYPFHLDMATSVVTGGKMEIYAKLGKEAPEGWAVDGNGAINRDAQDFVNSRGKSCGGLLPLGGAGELYGGHKGYGLSAVVEIMTGIMAGGAVSASVRRIKNVEKCCHMFLAADYGMFSDDSEIMEEQLSEFLQMLRDSEKADGEDRIYTHGEKEFSSINTVLQEGIPVNAATYLEIKNICNRCGIEMI
jgi:LDH2 family malate/lactate/ureidoglycolate dehydrogenase